MRNQLLVILLCIAAIGCQTQNSLPRSAAPQQPPISQLDFRSQFIPRFGKSASGWIEVDLHELSTSDVATCLADLRNVFGRAHYKLVKLYRHPKEAVLFAVFDSDDIDDGKVTFVFDEMKRRFIGKLATGGA